MHVIKRIQYTHIPQPWTHKPLPANTHTPIQFTISIFVSTWPPKVFTTDAVCNHPSSKPNKRSARRLKWNVKVSICWIVRYDNKLVHVHEMPNIMTHNIHHPRATQRNIAQHSYNTTRTTGRAVPRLYDTTCELHTTGHAHKTQTQRQYSQLQQSRHRERRRRHWIQYVRERTHARTRAITRSRWRHDHVLQQPHDESLTLEDWCNRVVWLTESSVGLPWMPINSCNRKLWQ